MSDINFNSIFQQMEQVRLKLQPVQSVYDQIQILIDVYGQETVDEAIWQYENDKLIMSADINMSDIMGGK